MSDLLYTPIFGILISIVAYEIGLLIYRKTKLAAFNPLLISIILIMVLLKSFSIELDTYNIGGKFISIFLAPATVILAVPLYNKIDILKKSFKEIIIGITVGSLTSVVSVVLLSKLLGVNEAIRLSLVPKSITTPVGIELSKQIGGIPSITVAAIVITGIVGAVFIPSICKFFKIRDKVALGIAIGTSSHALGTTKAMELGEVEGAMSGLAIGITALITVLIAPLILLII
jgi:predicted murein hydrolase (TIGR00659 family)